jgi:hypothetical protein
MVIGLLQLPVTTFVVAISVEDSAMKKAGMFFRTRRKGKKLS